MNILIQPFLFRADVFLAVAEAVSSSVPARHGCTLVWYLLGSGNISIERKTNIIYRIV